MLRSCHLVACTLAVVGCVGTGNPHHSHTLIRVDSEAEGANCKYGGKVIHSGVDTNKNNVLDDGEITSSEYLCNASSSVRCRDADSKLDGPVSLSVAADFAQLDGIHCIDGDLMIVGSDLQTFPAVPALRTVTGNVIIAGNGELVSLDGFSGLREVGKRFVVQGNDAVVDISAVGQLQRFQSVVIVGNDALVDLSGLSTFVEIDGGLQISNNSALTSLAGLDNLVRSTREAITIRSNKSLSSITALDGLRSAVLVEISGNATLQTAALPSLERVDVYLLVKDNAALVSLDLPKLFTTGGLIVQSTPALTSLNAPELKLSGAVTIEHATSLTAVDLPKLSYNTVNIDLVNLPRLTQASFPALVAIGGPFAMSQLPQLPDLTGFSNLSSIGGNFTMRSCNALADFSGFGKLVDVANMTVTLNSSLASFSGLSSFQRVGGNLVISSNPSLSSTAAQAFASAIAVSGTITIN